MECSRQYPLSSGRSVSESVWKRFDAKQMNHTVADRKMIQCLQKHLKAMKPVPVQPPLLREPPSPIMPPQV